jgi:hypothetical protein
MWALGTGDRESVVPVTEKRILPWLGVPLDGAALTR